MRVGRIVSACALFALAGIFACMGCAESSRQTSSATETKSVLNPSDPVQVTLWTYYNGTQQQAFEDLVKEFNANRGKSLGVVVSSASQGGVTELTSAVIESAEERVGSAPMPDAFLAYSDTASVIDDLGLVADLSHYLSDDEKSQYVESFLAEGDINGDGGLKLFPVAKSTETIQANLTDWRKFAEATGSQLDDLATIEGITATAQRYYEWTDEQTPDVVGDGHPFFGRDAVANYLITGSKQLGHELLDIKEGTCTLNFDRATMETLWDNYYVPMVQGWFSAEGKFRSDAVKTGNLICYLGSSSSVVYFPKMVTIDDQTSYPIELVALAAPTFENGTPCAPQQGAGFAVTKSSEKKEVACVEFLKWLTDKEQGTSFSINAGYVPVKKDALVLDNLQSASQSMEGISENYLANLPATLETIENGVYATPPFKGGVQVRTVLDQALSSKAIADRAAVVAAIEAGVSPSDAVAPYLEEAVFDDWLANLATQLETAVL